MFYKLIDENTVRKAPNTLEIDGRFVFTTDEKIYNRCGYYKIQELPLPADGRGYTPKYRFEDSLILKDWKLVESVAPTYKERVPPMKLLIYFILSKSSKLLFDATARPNCP